MKKCLLATAVLMIIGQAALAETDNQTKITCPSVDSFKSLPVISATTNNGYASYGDNNVLPTRFDIKLQNFATSYKESDNYTSNIDWSMNVYGVRAKDISQAIINATFIFDHLTGSTLRPSGYNQFFCEYTIDPAALAELGVYADSDTKPNVTASAYVYNAGNYLFAKQ